MAARWISYYRLGAVTTRPLLSASLEVSRAGDVRVATERVLHALRFGGPGFALVTSAVVHGALALTIVHSGRHTPAHVGPARSALIEIEIAIPDEAADPPASTQAPQAAALARPHVHPYPLPPSHDLVPHDPALEHRPSTSVPSEPASAPFAAAAEPVAATPHFAMTVGAVSRATGNAPAAAGGVAGVGPVASGAPVPEASVDVPASLLAGSAASYTREAEAAGIEANVPLEIVVDQLGAVSEARVLSHVGYGLDEAALRAIRGYRFAPARRAGQALAVRMRWLMRFQLR